jgi:hypothetical protein
MNGTIIEQGSFFSTGAPVTLNLRQGVDWIQVQNFTQSGVANINNGVSYFWTTEMGKGTGIVQFHPAADNTLAINTIVVPAGFTPYDSSSNPVGAPLAITSIDNANPPSVLVASTAALIDGDVVRVINTAGAIQLGGIDFTIDVVDGTHFSLVNMPAIVAAAGPGTYRVIAHGPLYQPVTRVITSITQAAQAVVTTSVDHNYSVGDACRFSTNADGYENFGMVEIDGLTGNVVAVTQHTFTVDIDSTAFTPFVFPLTGNGAFSPAIVVPFGENAVVGSLNSATVNTGIIGITLAAGALSPAGTNGDLIFWQAGTSFSTNN